jgi:PAS domain S-box-containing protein
MIDTDLKRWIRAELFHQVPVSISVIDRDYRIVEANENLEETFGAWQGRYCYEVYKNRTEPCDTCQATRTFEDGQVRVTRETGVDRDGEPISYMMHLAPLVEKDGGIRYVIEMSTDISEVAFLQDRLREETERYRLLFEEVPCFITIQDRDFKLLETNRLFREHFGEPQGRFCYEVYKHRDEQCYPCPVAETFEDGQVRRSEEVVTTKQGVKINVVCYTAPVRDSAGNITAVMEMSTDITQIRQLQSQLTSIGLLVSSLSHGVKGLLMGLDGGIYAVDSGLELGDTARVRSGWDMVKRNVGKVRSLVLDILYYAKDREPDWAIMNACELVAELRELMEARAARNGVAFSCECPGDIGALEADPKAIRSVLVNILENALDACRVDKQKSGHAVSLRVCAEDGFLVFEVSDNGIGMDRETREKLFTLFFSSKGTGGTGLGLFLSNKIVLKHGGAISVESEPGQGARFTVRIPRTKTLVPGTLTPELDVEEIAGLI